MPLQKKNGVRFGRPSGIGEQEAEFLELVQRDKRGELSSLKCAQLLDWPLSTYRYRRDRSDAWLK